MRKFLSVVGAIFVVFSLSLSGPSAQAVVLPASGELTSDVGGGLMATGTWADGGVAFTWSVTDVGDAYQYAYAITPQDTGPPPIPTVIGRAGPNSNGLQDPSHVIIAVSPSFTERDIWEISAGITEWEIGTYSGANPSNPGMVVPIYGLKVNFEDGVNSVTFLSPRAPVLANPYDLYVKGGSSTMATNDDTVSFLRPDTDHHSVDLLGTLPLFGIGGIALIGLSRRRR